MFLFKNFETKLKWNELSIDFGSYGFISLDDPDEFWGKNKISLKAGDYNLNGYVDLMVILKDNK